MSFGGCENGSQPLLIYCRPSVFLSPGNASAIVSTAARALARTGRFVTAVYELNSALVCKPKPKEPLGYAPRFD